MTRARRPRPAPDAVGTPPAGSHHLILSLTPRPAISRRTLFSWVDLGHVEILVWSPPAAPEAHALCPAPTTQWRMFVSAFWAQKARVSRILGFPGRPSYWQRWPMSPEAAEAVSAYLARLRDDCLKGRVRYRAIWSNCFHVALRCMELAGVDPLPVRNRWVLSVPIVGARLFRRAVMRGLVRSSLAEHFAGRPAARLSSDVGGRAAGPG